jgi:hypothetical protein
MPADVNEYEFVGVVALMQADDILAFCAEEDALSAKAIALLEQYKTPNAVLSATRCTCEFVDPADLEVIALVSKNYLEAVIYAATECRANLMAAEDHDH